MYTKITPITLLCIICITVGCGLVSPAKKPNVGPIGQIKEEKIHKNIFEQLKSPPPELFDLEQIAGVIFAGINTEEWSQAQSYLPLLHERWNKVKTTIVDKESISKNDKALAALNSAINNKQISESHKSLEQFMGGLNDIAKEYKLSPLPDIIAIGGKLRNVSFFVAEKDWQKASLKVKELEDSWEQMKPGLEQVGIMGEITKIHSSIKQLKDAINAENKAGADEHLNKTNESISRVINFYRK